MPVGPKPGVPPSSFDGVWKRNGNAAALLLGMTRIDGKVRQGNGDQTGAARPEQSDVSRFERAHVEPSFEEDSDERVEWQPEVVET